jgi:hypothetical protein
MFIDLGSLKIIGDDLEYSALKLSAPEMGMSQLI